jgi:hypothetical protein
MAMTTDVLDTLATMRTKQAQAAERNRRDFPFAAEMLDTVRTMDPTARIVYAENAEGRSVGKRDPGPWISADQIIRADDYARIRVRGVREGRRVAA